MEPESESFGLLITRVADALAQEAELHAQLFRAELARDAQCLARDSLPLALSVPLLIVGHACASVALAIALGGPMGMAPAFALVSVLNLLAGALAVRWSLARLRNGPGAAITFVPELASSARSFAGALAPDAPPNGR